MIPNATMEATINNQMGQPAASMMCNTRVFSGQVREKRDFKPRIAIRQLSRRCTTPIHRHAVSTFPQSLWITMCIPCKKAP